MRAPQNELIDPLLKQRLEHPGNIPAPGIIVRQIIFHRLHPALRRDGVQGDGPAVTIGQGMVPFCPQCCGGRQNGNIPGKGPRSSRFDRGFNARNGDGAVRAQALNRHARGGIAGHHDLRGALRGEPVADGPAAVEYELVRQGSVRAVPLIRDKNGRHTRHHGHQRLQDG